VLGGDLRIRLSTRTDNGHDGVAGTGAKLASQVLVSFGDERLDEGRELSGKLLHHLGDDIAVFHPLDVFLLRSLSSAESIK
jgi:hypothetical protein